MKEIEDTILDVQPVGPDYAGEVSSSPGVLGAERRSGAYLVNVRREPDRWKLHQDVFNAGQRAAPLRRQEIDMSTAGFHKLTHAEAFAAVVLSTTALSTVANSAHALEAVTPEGVEWWPTAACPPPSVLVVRSC
ncbi:hypothetical protein [Roseobacter sinensis]|uniref:Uncharacterized protein n=1 Tax=Roseobacter sinensis TaxID=2931391 RepID=A0ABT3BJE5_9RHOB|nr:hypothetical protein [Roseobacter sp. WL0113]MCV3273693.1 hypothetical protein [Roseobacter sp. WL0113]